MPRGSRSLVCSFGRCRALSLASVRRHLIRHAFIKPMANPPPRSAVRPESDAFGNPINVICTTAQTRPSVRLVRLPGRGAQTELIICLSQIRDVTKVEFDCVVCLVVFFFPGSGNDARFCCASLTCRHFVIRPTPSFSPPLSSRRHYVRIGPRAMLITARTREHKSKRTHTRT